MIIMKYFRNIIIILILLAGIFFSQRFYDTAKAKETKPSPFVPSAAVVKSIDLGLNSAASSLYWLAAIQYFGDWQTDDYGKIDDYIRLSNDLDPKFSHPYAFAALILPGVGMTDQSIEIAKRGVEQADPNWEIPYYLASTYHSNKQDTKNAAKYFDIAAHTAGAPDNIKWIAANYGSRPDIREQTKLIWQGIAENSNDEVIRKRAEIYVYHFELMDFLEQAAKAYKDKYGSYPDPIEKLVDGKILKEIPKDPFGYKYSIDPDGRVRIVFQQ